MSTYRLTHLDDATLLSGLTALVSRDRAKTAELLAHIAEVDSRRLYAPAGYSSMFAYCLGELRLSEDATAKRIQAARAARRFPRLFDDLAAGRLHLTAVCVLAPSLTGENIDELVAAAAGRSKDKLEAWLADHFGAAPLPSTLRARVIVVRPAVQPAPRDAAGELELAPAGPAADEHALAHVGARPEEHALAHVPPAPRYVVQVPIGEATHAKLRRAQALLAHAVPGGELAEVLDRALDALLVQLEKRKGAAPVRPSRASARPALPATRGRAIPAAVRRAVWVRDGGRCTFTGSGGRQCGAERMLEFDHVVSFAQGGESTVEGLRLRCRAHNQLEAERAFGREFMQHKRADAAAQRDPEVESALRGLGCRGDEARLGAAHTAALGAATIEERLRGALQYLGAARSLAGRRAVG